MRFRLNSATGDFIQGVTLQQIDQVPLDPITRWDLDVNDTTSFDYSTINGDGQFHTLRLSKPDPDDTEFYLWLDNTLIGSCDADSNCTSEVESFDDPSPSGKITQWYVGENSPIGGNNVNIDIDYVYFLKGTALLDDPISNPLVTEGGMVPTTFTWRVDAGGDWTNGENWTPTLSPSGRNHTAVFGDAILSPRTVFTDTAQTLNSIQFNNTTSYVIAGFGLVNLVASTTQPSVNPSMDVRGSHQFQVAVSLSADATVNVASESTLTFNNTLDLMGHTLTKTGTGTMAIRNDLTLAGGTVDLQEGTISGNGTIGGDVNNGGGTISPGGGSPAQGGGGVPEPAAWLMLAMECLLTLLRRRHPHRRP